MKKLIIIKLGGSVITYKDSLFPKARTTTIRILAKDIIQLHKQGYKIILVHGGGSFGHLLANKYKLNRGTVKKNQQEAFVKIAEVTLKLNKIIMDQFILEGLPVISLLPRSFIFQTNSKMNDFDFFIVESLLKTNFIPVLCGDILFDSKLGCSIISGDTIVGFLANKLKVSEVIFLSDVNGIFNKNPKKYNDAKLIAKVNNQNFEEVLLGMEAGNRADVTGEMVGKILTIKNSLKNVKVTIANGFKKGLLIKIIDSQDEVGTRLLFD